MTARESFWRRLANLFPRCDFFQWRAFECLMARVEAMPVHVARSVGLREGWPEWFVDRCIVMAHNGISNQAEWDAFCDDTRRVSKETARNYWPRFFEEGGE